MTTPAEQREPAAIDDQIGCPFCPQVHTVTYAEFNRCYSKLMARIVASRIPGLDQAGFDPDEVQE